MLRRLLKKRMPWDGPHDRSKGPVATADDLYYCYRLLLNREPDAPGYEGWVRAFADHQIPIKDLVGYFIGTGEFSQAHFGSAQEHFSLANTTIDLVELDRFRMYVNSSDPAVGYAVTQNLYEPHVLAELRRRLKPGDVALDVGANIGFLALAAAEAVGPEGRVIAVEPSPENALLLRTSVAANGFRHVEVHQIAASDSRANFVLEVEGSNGRMVPIGQYSTGSRQRYLIFARPLDELLAGLDRLDLVKLDIEGAEPMAVAGMRATLARLRPAIISEFSPEMLVRTSGTQPAAYLQTLRELGYRLSAVGEGGDEPLPASWETISARFFADGRSHIDILATPL